MNPTTEGLRKLYRLQGALQEVADKLTNGPRRIAAAEKKCAAKNEEHAAQKEAITELRKAADGKSLQLKSNEAKIVDLKAKLNMASSNKEYDIIKSQIDADEMANSVLEDEILDALEKVDAATQKLESIQDEQKALDAKMKEVEGKVREAEAGLNAEAESLRTQIAEAEKVIPEQMQSHYDRLVKAHASTALAPVDSNSCLQCFNVISPQERVQLNVGKVILCRICGRIMFAGEDSD